MNFYGPIENQPQLANHIFAAVHGRRMPLVLGAQSQHRSGVGRASWIM
jgi:hypothetical protein